VSGHTPGPWKEADSDGVLTVYGYPYNGIVCDVRNYYEANARLIAAAPDLLEALKAFVTWTESGAPGMKPPPLTCKVVDAARAAIAKATEPTP
jgi:hypothetical protein